MFNGKSYVRDNLQAKHTIDKRMTLSIYQDVCSLPERPGNLFGVFFTLSFLYYYAWVFCFPLFQLYCSQEWQGLRKTSFKDISSHQDSELTLEKAKHLLYFL